MADLLSSLQNDLYRSIFYYRLVMNICGLLIIFQRWLIILQRCHPKTCRAIPTANTQNTRPGEGTAVGAVLARSREHRLVTLEARYRLIENTMQFHDAEQDHLAGPWPSVISRNAGTYWRAAASLRSGEGVRTCLCFLPWTSSLKKTT